MRELVITKCNSYFITKCDKCYYKVRQVLQSVTILLQSATGITKCVDYNKVRQNTPLASLSASPSTSSEHNFSNSSWPVFSKNCFSGPHSLKSCRQYTVQPSILPCRILRYDVWPDSSSILLICTVMLRALYQYSSNTDHFFGLTLVMQLPQVPLYSCGWNGRTSCNTRR